MLDTRTAQAQLEDLLRDTILQALGYRLPSVASVAALRAVGTQGASGTVRADDDLIAVVAVSTTAYRWSSEATAADNGTSVIKPSDVSGNGRWLRWTSPLRFSPTVGGISVTLDQITSGPLRRLIVLDKSMSGEDIELLLSGAVPAVAIEATDDDPEDATLAVGQRWNTEYRFEISILTRNYRDCREATHGTNLDEAEDLGAYAIDGALKALLSGVQLQQVLPGIRAVRIGRGRNWFSEFGQRRVIRSRTYTIYVTECLPQASNETGTVEQVDYQAQLTELNEAETFDPLNYVASGLTVAPGVGLVRTVAAGAAIVTGEEVTYAGELHTFASSSDTYRDLNPDSTMTFVAVAAGVDAPAVTSNALRVGVTRTDGSGIVSDRMVAAIKTPFGPVYEHPLT